MTKAVKILPWPGTPLQVQNCLSNHYKTCNYILAMLLTCDNFGGILLYFLWVFIQKIFFFSKTHNQSYHGICWANWLEKRNYMYIEWMLGWLCDLYLLPHPWPWPCIFAVPCFWIVALMKGMWVDRLLGPLCDLDLWPHPWPWTYNIKFKL